MSRTEAEAWKYGTDSCQRGRERGEWWKEGEGTSQRICMNDHRPGYRCGDCGNGGGLARGGQMGKNWDNCNRKKQE